MNQNALQPINFWYPVERMSVYLMLLLAVSMLFLPMLQQQKALAELPGTTEELLAIAGTLIAVGTLIVTYINRPQYENCPIEGCETVFKKGDDNPDHILHAPCAESYYTCSEDASRHASQTCSNNPSHTYYLCVPSSVWIHTSWALCPSGLDHGFPHCASEATKMPHYTQKTCSKNHTYYLCDPAADQHKNGTCPSSPSESPSNDDESTSS